MDIREQFEQEFTRLVYNLKAINTEFRTGYDKEGEAYVYPINDSEDKQKNKEFVNATNLSDSIKETNNYVENIDATFYKMSLENMNKINSGLSYIYHNVCKFKKLKTIRIKRMKALAAADATILQIGSMANFDKDKSKKEFDLEITNWQSELQKQINYYNNLSTLTRKQKNALKKCQENIKFKRFGVYSSPENLIKETVIHELGHTIAYQAIQNDQENGGKISFGVGDSKFETYKASKLNTETALLLRDTLKKARTNGDIYKISQYANTNTQEFFAESFLMYNIGEKMPDYIQDMVEKIIKKI